MNTSNTGILLAAFRKRRNAALLAAVGVIGFIGLWCFGFFLTDRARAIVATAPWSYFTFLPFWVLALAGGLYLHNQKCPRCDNKMAVHKDGFFYNSFTTKCLNCGLSRKEIENDL